MEYCAFFLKLRYNFHLVSFLRKYGKTELIKTISDLGEARAAELMTNEKVNNEIIYTIVSELGDIEYYADIKDLSRISKIKERLSQLSDALTLTGTFVELSGQVVEALILQGATSSVAEERLENVPRIHDLRRLWEIVSDQFQEALDVDLLRELTDVYTDSRYPGDLGLTPSGGPTEKDAVRFEQFAVDVHAKVLAVLS